MNQHSTTPAETRLELTTVQAWRDLELHDLGKHAAENAAPESDRLLDELLLYSTPVELYRFLRLARFQTPPEARGSYWAFLTRVGNFIASVADSATSPVSDLKRIGQSAHNDPVLVFASKLAALRFEQDQSTLGAGMLRAWETEIAGMIRATVRVVYALPPRCS